MTNASPLIQGLSEQYGAGLKMVQYIIENCDDTLWNDYNREVVINQVVYHIIDSTDFYLSNNKAEVDSYEPKLGKDDGTFHDPSLKFTKQQLLDYLEVIKKKANKKFDDITLEDLDGQPLFDWHGTSVLGSLLYNLRHIMLHVGALHVRLNEVSKETLGWVSKIYGDERDVRDELHNRGITFLQQGKLDEAEKVYLELIENSKDSRDYYNLACCYSLKNNSEKALNMLKTCLKYDQGNRFKGLAQKDKDFNNVRELPAFKELLTN